MPHVVGKPLAKAKTRIRNAHCRVGRVSYRPVVRRKQGKVLAEHPKAGRRLANGARVDLVVGRR